MNAKRPFDLWLSENIEAIAIAIAMALILKFFIVEAYQIPTGSMQPTILGYQAPPNQPGLRATGHRGTDIKDRVLADKLITMLRPPKRWEVMIFRFPLDERRLYVKRIVGLPGETLEVRGGDVWIDGTIAAKPDHVNESVLKQVLPSGPAGVDLGRWFTASEGVSVAGPAATFAADAPDAELRLRASVKDAYLHGYDPAWRIPAEPGYGAGTYAVADLDLSLDVRLDAGAEALRLTVESDEGDTLFVLPAAGSGETARVELLERSGATRATLPLGERSLPPGEELSVTARTVDHRIVLWVDGEEWLRHDDVSGPRESHPSRALVRIALDGGGVVDDVELRRDIFYTDRVASTRRAEQMALMRATESNGGSIDDLPYLLRWEIPEDSYFGLGDNTQSSHDGRSWETRTFTLKDGRRITGFDFNKPGAPDRNPQPLLDNQLAFADVHGDVYFFRRDEIVDEALSPAPFIHRRYLLGKAVLVFWPVWDPFRWTTIR